MKSLRFILLKRPINNDDFISLLESGETYRVKVEAETKEYVREFCILSVFIGRFTWTAVDGERKIVEERFGAYRLDGQSDRIKKSIAAANERLETRINAIRKAGAGISDRTVFFASVEIRA